MTAVSPDAPGSESAVEVAKRASRALRGTVAETLASEASHFEDDDKTVLKFHGIYQQDDRDSRRARLQGEQGKAYSFMVRVAAPAGVLSAEQYLALDRLAASHGNGALRLTTRQGVQFHGVVLDNLHGTVAGINQALLTTLAACGDVRRNVIACPAPFDDAAHRAVRAMAAAIAQDLAPRTRAYHEIWLDGEKLDLAAPGAESEEPFYGSQYLPRKFKVAVGLDFDNCVDIYNHDCALLAITRHGQVLGYNLLAGGGLGMTHNKPDTVARLATPLGFVPRELGVAAVRAVAAVFRDHGNRADRRHARIKYLLEAWGVERFRAAVEAELGAVLAPPVPVAPVRQEDHLGAHAQGDGRFFYGVFVESGRVVDRPGQALATALREIAERLAPGFHLTPMQGVLLTDLGWAELEEVEATLRRHGVPRVESLSAARRYALACPALPTCGLALTDAERALPAAVEALERELVALGLGAEPLALRLTGCPNGCARPYNADIALVGRRPGVYHLYVGGGLAGDRLADLYAADVPLAELVPVLRPLLERWRDERLVGEGLGDFYQRLAGHPEPRRLLTGREVPSALPLVGVVAP
jgi:sulfite reductase (ferredoxin)